MGVKLTGNFYSSTPCQKFATAGIISALAFFAVGFVSAAWTSVEVLHYQLNDRIFEKLGLWQRWTCTFTADESICLNKGTTGNPVWFIVTQVSVTIALIGLVISGLISIHQLLSKRNRKWKQLNIFIQVIAGVFGICGVTAYGIGSKTDSENVNFYFEKNRYKNLILKVTIDFSYYFCCIAIGLVFIVSVPLFICDERKLRRVKREAQVKYNGRGRSGVNTAVRNTAIATVAKTVIEDTSQLSSSTAVKKLSH